MAAYASVISLKHTINALLNSSSSSSTREIFGSAYDEATSLQQVLERLNERSRSKSSMKTVDALEGQIRDCANKLEDFLESMNEKVEEDDKEVRKEISSFREAAKTTAKDYLEELSREDDNDDDDDNDDPAAIDVSDSGVEMVGHSKLFTDIRKQLLGKMRPVDLCFFSHVGNKGGGRTKIAKGVYEDLSKSRGEYFDCWAWVTVQHQQLKQVLISIIVQVLDKDNSDDDNVSHGLDESELSKYLYEALEKRRYLIVLDDVDDAELVEYLKRTSFPDESNGSVVIVTTASNDVAQLTDNVHLCKLPARFFQESLWPPLRIFLFEFRSVIITPEMEEAGIKIIQNCRCSVIAAAKTYLFLSQADQTVEQWRKIAADEDNPIFTVVDELSEISKIKTELQFLDMSDQMNRIIASTISELVEFSPEIEARKMMIHPERVFSKMQIISIIGMAGIGKTTFTRKFFEDESIRHHFDHHVWITLGSKYQAGDILIDILAEIYPTSDKLHMKEDEILIRDLCVQLSYKKCLIVLDDLCNKEPLFHLRDLFPDITGTTLVTTRLVNEVRHGTREDYYIRMEFLNKEESWCLLRQKVFVQESCPPELEKVGRIIAEKCDGLPLLIIVVADHLLNVEISQEFWNDVASGKDKLVFKNAHHQISRSLLPSYEGLPQYLKPLFLYLGVFREKYEIPASNLTHLWISEGFLEPNSQEIEEIFVIECLEELVHTSLLLAESKFFSSQIKTCRLHSVFWHLCNSQAVKNKFFHGMNSYGDCPTESVESQRRLCIRNNVLLGMKNVQKSIASYTSVHSFLCVGPTHQFPVPLNFDLTLLRVKNAVTIRLYEFPIEVMRLLHLRYLGLMCNGVIPSLISKLRKLQYLILKQYTDIRSSQNSLHLPVEIWDMKELEHLEVTGGHMPNHKSGPGLLKLITLIDVSAESCRKKVLRWIPNLKRLDIRIELAPGNASNYSFHCLNHISRLHRLESLKCVVVNPQFRSGDASPPPPISMFPRGLKRLSLSGLGYSWEDMPIIGALENLEVLKLKNRAFQGPKWEIDRTSPFTKLKFLLLQNTDMIEWKANSVTMMRLDRLSIKHCYRLQDLPVSSPIGPSTKIEIVDSNPLVVTWAKYLVRELFYREPQISLSWID